MGVIQKAQFGNEGALAVPFQRSDLLQDIFKDDLPQIWLSHHLLSTRGFIDRCWLVPFVLGHFELAVLSFVFRCLMPTAGAGVFNVSLMGLMAFYAWWGDMLLKKLLHACSVPGRHCKNIVVEVLVSLRCMHAKVQADYWILMALQWLVRSVPWGGVALDGKTEGQTVVCEYHEGFNAVPAALHASTLPVSCPVFKYQGAWGRWAGAGAEQSHSRPATIAMSLCHSDIPVPGSVALAAACGCCAAGLAGASLSLLVSSPPPSHPAAHIKPWRFQAPAHDISLHLRPFLNW